MDSASSIAASGMYAAEQRLSVAAYNVANANTDVPPVDPSTGPTDTFQPLRADQVDTPGGGTAVTVRAALPTDVFASVDLANESVQVVAARYMFAANVAVMRTVAEMQKTLLDTFA